MINKKIRDEIIKLRKDGNTFEEIATQLNISVSSAKKYYYEYNAKQNIDAPPSPANHVNSQIQPITPVNPDGRDPFVEIDRLTNIIEDLQKRLFAPPTEVKQETPIEEEVEMESDRMKYSIYLNPEMWYYYEVFKARAIQRGNPWRGDFGAFCELGIREMFKAYNITPMVQIRTSSGVMYTNVSPEEDET